MKTNQTKNTVNITFQLEGEEAELFLAYKSKEYLKLNAEAARKLMLSKLHEEMETESNVARPERPARRAAQNVAA